MESVGAENDGRLLSFLDAFTVEENTSNSSFADHSTSDVSDNHRQVPVQVPKDEVNSILAQALSNLSLNDRAKAYEEMHGVDPGESETPEFVEAKLNQLQSCLESISPKTAFEEAQMASPTYVNSQKFRLMFLRADYFDPEKAAFRMVKFMEGKLKIFGRETLGRPLRLTDLRKDDVEFMEKGTLQLLPVRDRAGRAVFMDVKRENPPAHKHYMNLVCLFLHLLFVKFRVVLFGSAMPHL